jgi:hypothetical protein
MIVDLAGCEEIQSVHLAGALQYRPKLMLSQQLSIQGDSLAISCPYLGSSTVLSPSGEHKGTAQPNSNYLEGFIFWPYRA